jgi:hypothetical protein
MKTTDAQHPYRQTAIHNHKEGGERSRFFLNHRKALQFFVDGWK